MKGESTGRHMKAKDSFILTHEHLDKIKGGGGSGSGASKDGEVEKGLKHVDSAAIMRRKVRS